VRYGWPEVVSAALELGRLEEAHALIDELATLPPGHVPPYLRAELARARGRLAFVEGRHEDVEEAFGVAVDGFRTLAYPYHLALAQTDRAAWLIDRERGEEAGALLEEAQEALAALGAEPALARARDLAPGSAPADVVSS
jgi:tetratricopeptide (TPR) repeat protein